MKKKGIATLALAGALAASMVPAFAAGTDTTVGYTAGGNTSTDGRVMVTVPKDVTFTAVDAEVSGFDVKAWVWDSVGQAWVTPGSTQGTGTTYKAPDLGKTIDVKVTSTNGYKLLNKDVANVAGSYKYVVEGKTLDEALNDQATTEQAIGTLKDGTADAKYALTGSVTMTTTPDLGQKDKAVYFSDVLTYSFTGL